MRYLKLRRAQIILACFLLSSIALVAFSNIDIRISRLFFDNGFYLADQGWARLLHGAVGALLVVSIGSVVGLYLFNRFSKRRLGGVDGRKVLYLLLVLILGAGLIVNVVLKDNFGRVRPRDIAEFGGSRDFTPAFVIGSQCKHNCSFSSGDGAGAFYYLAFFMAFSRRRAVALAAVGFGISVSVARIASGAHFFSDTVVSFFVMLIVADALHYYMLVPKPVASEDGLLPKPGLQSAPESADAIVT